MTDEGAPPPPAPPAFPPNADLVALFNAHRGGFEQTIGLVFTKVERDEVAAEVPVGPHLTQPYGLVHGGVYASIVETLASAGAAIHAMAQGKTSVGLENTTSFLRAVRAGKLIAVATPVHRGRGSQVWEVKITDELGRLAATGRLRTLSLEPGASVAGEVIAVKT
ncbi:MAG TPA: PaaI family thioesterase [Kofleriaceae bacterium]|nr:PaaI family thioesterase [Kofleriaceae bacterium]